MHSSSAESTKQPTRSSNLFQHQCHTKSTHILRIRKKAAQTGISTALALVATLLPTSSRDRLLASSLLPLPPLLPSPLLPPLPLRNRRTAT